MGKLVTEVRVESIHLYYLFTVAVGDSSAQGFSFLSASTRDERSLIGTSVKNSKCSYSDETRLFG